MANCPTCEKPGYEPDETLRNLRKLDWDDLYYATNGDKFYNTPFAMIEVVFTPDGQEYDSYGSRVEDESFVVVRVPDGRLFKREMARDSYGTCNWSTAIREVKGEARTVVVFEYA